MFVVEVLGATDDGKCEHCGGTIELMAGYVVCPTCDHDFDFRPLPPRPTDSVVRDFSPRPTETVVGEADEGGIRPAVVCCDCGVAVRADEVRTIPLCDRCWNLFNPEP